MKRLLLVFFVGLVCSLPERAPVADLVWHNAKIYTGDISRPVSKRWAEAVAVKDGKIIYVGSNSGVDKYIDDNKTKVVNLWKSVVLPGFHDSHAHPLESGNPMALTCPLTQDTDPEKFIPILKKCKNKQKGTKWVLGGGHSVYNLVHSKRSPLAIIDEAIPDKPAVMLEATSHSGWVNSKALEKLGWDKNTPDPEAGFLGRDEVTGELNGIIYENAVIMANDMAYGNATKEMDDLTYDGLMYGIKQMNKYGVTAVVDARCFWERRSHEVWKKAYDNGDLTLRATLGLWAYPHLDDDYQLRKLGKLFDKGDDKLRITQIKMYDDGITEAGSAALVEPYLHRPNLYTTPYGFNYFSQKRMTKYVTELEKAGFDMHVHTIGDRASKEVLNAIESAMQTNKDIKRDRRHRLTHLELIHPTQYNRFNELNVIADFQLNGDFTDPANYRKNNEELIGDRYKRILPVRTIWDTNAMVTLSSDWDVSPITPFRGIHRSLAKRNESLPDIYAALQAYTMNAAFLMRLENKTGSINLGKYADMVVIDQDIFNIPIRDIKYTTVLQTLFEGREVFTHDDFRKRRSNTENKKN